MSKEETKKDKYVLGKVAIQEEYVAVNTETKEEISQLSLLIKLVNDVEEIKKNIVSQ